MELLVKKEGSGNNVEEIERSNSERLRTFQKRRVWDRAQPPAQHARGSVQPTASFSASAPPSDEHFPSLAPT